MKNNRRNRKAKYIKTKNRLRTGGVFNFVCKVSSQLKEDPDSLNAVIHDHIAFQSDLINKQYKIPVQCVHMNFGQIDDDFIRNIFRCRLAFRSKLYTAIRA